MAASCCGHSVHTVLMGVLMAAVFPSGHSDQLCQTTSPCMTPWSQPCSMSHSTPHLRAVPLHQLRMTSAPSAVPSPPGCQLHPSLFSPPHSISLWQNSARGPKGRAEPGCVAKLKCQICEEKIERPVSCAYAWRWHALA